jgi:hypothetical protein
MAQISLAKSPRLNKVASPQCARKTDVNEYIENRLITNPAKFPFAVLENVVESRVEYSLLIAWIPLIIEPKNPRAAKNSIRSKERTQISCPTFDIAYSADAIIHKRSPKRTFLLEPTEIEPTPAASAEIRILYPNIHVITPIICCIENLAPKKKYDSAITNGIVKQSSNIIFATDVY